MTITNAHYVDPEQTTVQITLDGHILFVPVDVNNRHWQEVLTWVALGNTIAPYVALPTPDRATQTIGDNLRIEGGFAAFGAFPQDEKPIISVGDNDELIALLVRLGLVEDGRI